jgi:hypothetical protein
MYLLLSRGKVNQPKVCLRPHHAPAPMAYPACGGTSFIQASMACAAVLAYCTPLVSCLLRNARHPAAAVLQVYFEHSLCMACEWDLFNVRAPTSYISLFAGLPYCNPFSLQQVSRL